jgi:hypothetical protein
MKLSIRIQKRSRSRGLTISEVLVACTIVAMLVMAVMASVYHTRIIGSKDAERGIVSGFMQHYAELIKALPFDQVRTNLPLSGLYTGANGSPKITFPDARDWRSLASIDYQTFHPNLLWVTNRNPEIRVSIESSIVGGLTHDKLVTIEVRWDAPFLLGPKQVQRLDLFRVRDL